MQKLILERAMKHQEEVHRKYDEKYKTKYLVNKDGSEKERVEYEQKITSCPHYIGMLNRMINWHGMRK